jgi:hypothetical protein
MHCRCRREVLRIGPLLRALESVLHEAVSIGVGDDSDPSLAQELCMEGSAQHHELYALGLD